MAQIRPFGAVRPKKGYEDRVAALPYDVFSIEEARREVEREPLSFLAIDRPETVSKEGEDICQNAGRLLGERMADGIFMYDELPCFYIYELTADGRRQTGVGALTGVDDYLSGVTKRHENTRADKEADRVRHVESCMAQTGPVFLAYRAREEIRMMTGQIRENQEALYDFTASDGVRHRLWRIQDEEEIESIYEAFAQVESFYIADGHHRCAAAVSYALKKRRENPEYTGEEPWNFILSVLFPDDELKIMDYNRVVSDHNGMTEKQLLNRISQSFTIEYSGEKPVKPEKKGEFAMCLQDGWYTLCLRKEPHSGDPVENLDVELLQNRLLSPVLGIAEPRTDERISFVGGIRGTTELARRVKENGGAAFWLHPTGIGELFAVADAGRLMPPKSTWFEPKLRSGLLIYSLREQ